MDQHDEKSVSFFFEKKSKKFVYTNKTFPQFPFRVCYNGIIKKGQSVKRLSFCYFCIVGR